MHVTLVNQSTGEPISIDIPDKKEGYAKPDRKQHLTSYEIGQYAVLDKQPFIYPVGLSDATAYAITYQVDGEGNIFPSYTDGIKEYIGDSVSATEFCGQMTALINILLQNGIVNNNIIDYQEEYDRTISCAIKNLVINQFCGIDSDVGPVNDFGFNNPEEEDFYSGEVGIVEDFVPREDLDVVHYDYNDVRCFPTEEDIWCIDSEELLTDYDTINWNTKNNNLSKKDITGLPSSADEFCVTLKSLCQTISDKLYESTEDADINDLELIAVGDVSPSLVYLTIISYLDLVDYVSTDKNYFSISLGRDSYTGARDILVQGILNYSGIDPKEYESESGIPLDVAYEDLFTIVSGVIDKAFCTATLIDNNL